MKVCYIGSVYPRNEKDYEVPWLRKTVNLLKESGVDIEIFVPSFKGLKDHTIDGVKVKRFRYFFAPLETLTHDEGAPNKINKFHYKVITIFYILLGMIKFALYHKKNKFDILHIHWPFPHAFFGYFAKLFYNTKIVLNFHGASLLLVNKYPFVKYFLKFFIKKADVVIANSSFTKEKITNICKRDIKVIPYGTTIMPDTKILDSIIKNKDPKMLLAVGRLIERKGFIYLIEAMNIVCKKDSNVVLTIAGGGFEYNRLKNRIKELGLEKRIFLPGKVSDSELNELYKKASIFILPAIIDSRGDTEGLGVVLIEAITYGCAVIASDVGGIGDVIINNETGILVPQKNIEKLADAILQLVNDKEKCLLLIKNAALHVNKNFSWYGIINRIKDIYNSLI